MNDEVRNESKFTKSEILAKNLTMYEGNYEAILSILNKLTDEEVETLAYNCYRTSEKIGEDAFSCRFLAE